MRKLKSAGIVVDKTAVIHKLVHIQVSTRGTRVVIGAGTEIDAFVKIKPTGGPGDVVIGDRCFINSCTVIYSGNGVHIGNDVLIGPNVSLVPINHEYADATRTIKSQGYAPSKGGIVIGNDVWIGAGCTILDGAKIRDGAVIGAGSLVHGEIAPYSVNVGSPTRQVGFRGGPDTAVRSA